MKLCAILLSLTVLSACGTDDTPTSPSTNPPPAGPRTGTWVGSISDPFHGTGTLRLEIYEVVVDSAGSLTGGTWTATFTDATHNGAGGVGGLIRGSEYVGTLGYTPLRPCPLPTPGPPNQFAFTTTISSAEIVGTYWFSTCSGDVAGSIALRRQ